MHSNFDSLKMVNVRTFFSTVKKRDLRDNSKKQGEYDPKKSKESGANSCAESLGDSSYRDFLYNCLNNSQIELKDLVKNEKDTDWISSRIWETAEELEEI